MWNFCSWWLDVHPCHHCLSFLSWKNFYLPTQVDWDLDSGRGGLFDACWCVFSFWHLRKFTVMPSVHLEEPVCSSFFPNPSPFKSVRVLWEMTLKFWNQLKCLYNVLLNFGYRGNCFMCLWKTDCRCTWAVELTHSRLSTATATLLVLQSLSHK